MTSYAWSDLREQVIEACGNTPSAEQEQRIIDVFRQHPAAVMQGIEHVLDGHRRGIVRSPWAVLVTHVEKLATAIERTSVAVTDERERDRKVSQARQWMRSAGMHFDREAEIEDELFGERGMLRHWPELRGEMLTLWREVRPIGEQLDAEAVERGRRDVELRKRLAKREPMIEIAPVDPVELMRELHEHAERRVALAATKGNPFVDE